MVERSLSLQEQDLGRLPSDEWSLIPAVISCLRVVLDSKTRDATGLMMILGWGGPATMFARSLGVMEASAFTLYDGSWSWGSVVIKSFGATISAERSASVLYL